MIPSARFHRSSWDVTQPNTAAQVMGPYYPTGTYMSKAQFEQLRLQGLITAAKPPNVLLLITDQQRYPRHWPDFPGWLRDLTPNQHALEQNSLTFRRAFTNTSMCSPSRATLLTGPLSRAARRHPHPHPGRPASRPRQLAGGAPRAGRDDARPERPATAGPAQLRAGPGPGRPAVGQRARAQPDTQSLAHLLRGRGYEVAYKGKWHLTHPSGGELLGGWAPSDADRLRDEYGFADWEPPDAGENAKAEHFGAGNAGPLGLGWDEVYTRQVESWLGRPDLPEPFCLVVSLVNPHDVLGYPAQHVRGGYEENGFIDLGVKLPPTVRRVPARQALGPRADEDGHGRLPGPAPRRAGRSSSTSTSTPTSTAWWTSSSAG